MKQLLFTLCALAAFQANAQFIEPTDFRIGLVKEIIVTDSTGRTYVGELTKVKEKKQLVKTFSIKTKEGEKSEFELEQVKTVFAKATTVSRLSAIGNGTINRLDKQKLSKKTDTLQFDVVKNEEGDWLLLQVINPGYDHKIKVYANPSAGKTTSWTGFDGGLDRSYYVSKNGQPVFKLVKKDMKEKFALLFDDCATLKDKPKNWENFDNYIMEYDACQ